MKLGNFARIGVPLLAVISPNALYIKANFKETQVVKFVAGAEVNIIFDALPNNKIKGRLRNISPATGSKFSLIPQDNATGNFTKVVQRISVIIDFELAADILDKVKAGMSARVSIRR
jgi:membrane fusion protein (multidrug efflux system)